MLRFVALLGALGLALTAPAAHAAPASDAPVASPSPVAPVGVTVSGTERTGFGLHLGVAVGAGVLSVPAGLYLAAGVGSLSNALLWSALPALLSFGLVAPTLTPLAAWLVGNWHDPGRFGFWLPWTASVVVNALAMVAAGFAGMSIGLPAQIVLFSVLDGALLGGVSTATMRLFEKKPEALVSIRSFVPGVGETTLVPLSTVRF